MNMFFVFKEIIILDGESKYFLNDLVGNLKL